MESKDGFGAQALNVFPKLVQAGKRGKKQLPSRVFRFITQSQFPRYSSLAMVRRWIWFVPSKIWNTLESRKSFSTGYSRLTP